jgi:hypothetical protein
MNEMATPTQPAQNPDDELADFTDAVLEGKASGASLSADTELKALQETVLRLDRAFPQGDLETQQIRRLQAEFQSAARKEAAAPQPAWKAQYTRQRMVLAVAAVSLFAALCLVLPYVPAGTGGVEGSAGLQSSLPVLLAAVGLIAVLVIWLRRKK